jgi:hypothetical protein
MGKGLIGLGHLVCILSLFDRCPPVIGCVDQRMARAIFRSGLTSTGT